MNDHAGWGRDGLCVLCESDDPGAPCAPNGGPYGACTVCGSEYRPCLCEADETPSYDSLDERPKASLCVACGEVPTSSAVAVCLSCAAEGRP